MGLYTIAKTDGSTAVKNPNFLRSVGVLTEADFEAAHKQGICLVFDPAQNGWLRADTTDDLNETDPRAGWPSATTIVQLQTRLRFEAWCEDDAETFRALLDDPHVWAHLPGDYTGPMSIDTARDLITLSKDEALHLVRAIVFCDTIVGQVRLEYRDEEPELSYWLGQEHWGRGIGAHAVRSFVKRCFTDDPTLDHMIARVRPENTASLRILEKAGFIREGRSNAAPDWIILRRDRA